MTVDTLIERGRNLTLHEPDSLDNLHPTVDSHLQKIYDALAASSSKDAFLQTVQHDSPKDGQLIMNPLVSLDAFREYMKDAAASAQAPAPELDLSAPISDYYISSSHNTYLTGNQLYGDAAASAYTSVLLRGCRSVEVDVWDGEPDTPDSSGDSYGGDGAGLGSKLKQKIKSRTDKPSGQSQDTSSKGLPRSLSAKLGDALRRKSSKSASSKGTPTTPGEDAPLSQTPLKGEPRVLHGHTLTKGTTFREICYAIRDSAFVASDLPVVVSLEVHASLEQQQTMVDIINEAWKGLLVEVPSNADPEKLPTLAELKRKILIKAKSVPLNGAEDVAEEQISPQPTTESTEKTAEGQPQKPTKPSKVLEALTKLAVYTRAYHFNHFNQPEAKVPVHVFSLSEKAARDAHLNQCEALFEHNRFSLMRIYPFTFRVRSSNLDPTFYWRRGAQLVALNWQNLDKGMMLNYGMFTGTQGWELKPPGYRSSESSAESVPHRSLDLTVEVFAAQDLALPPGDNNEKGFKPYINCQLHVEEPESPVATGRDDASSDSEKSSYRRCTKSSSGRNPSFEGQKLVFPTVMGVVEKLSFLRFKIKDDEFGRDSLAAWACIRLDRLREGYRLVHLHDCTGEKTGGALLVRITKSMS